LVGIHVSSSGQPTTARERKAAEQPDRGEDLFIPKTRISQTALVGEVVSRLERKGLVLRELRLHQISRREAEDLYRVHRGKPFFRELVEHVTSGPVMLMVIEGPNVVDTVRKLVGATNPLVAEPGTIRGDLSTSITANIIHASDSAENARREASIFFKDAI